MKAEDMTRGWEWYDVRAERAQRAWLATKEALPVGTAVRGRVFACQPFGVFVDIEGHPDALGLLEVTAIPRGTSLPAVGTTVHLLVRHHVDHHAQVKLSVDELGHTRGTGHRQTSAASG